ncbi:MAG: metal-dependent transcriptional regulator [Chloroflexi bacterium]|nr:metal-dependent transcriptional regulator [Chloroflexota bacterium]
MISPVVEEYLQTLHFMLRDGQQTIAARLAKRLGLSAPTVTVTLRRMARDGLVTFGAHREILLTESGREAAETSVRRHALVERLLTDFLQMPWDEAHEESHGIEHAVTPKVERQLLIALNNPTTCPHGNPIPGLGSLHPGEFPLDQVRAGEEVVLERITEEAEVSAELMHHLQTHGLAPGARLRVARVEAFNSLLVVDGPAGEAILGLDAAAKLRARRP